MAEEEGKIDAFLQEQLRDNQILSGTSTPAYQEDGRPSHIGK